MLRIIIADDELAARRRLKRLLETETGVSVVGEFSDGRAAVEGIARLKPNVALLDIQMPEIDGLAVAAEADGEDAPAIIFVTAFDQYALRAFDVHAVDYLVKPVDENRLRETLGRVRARVEAADRGSSSAPTGSDFARLAQLVEEMRHRTTHGPDTVRRSRDRLLVGVDGRSILVPTAEVDWIEASGNYVKLHRGANTLMLRESLASVEANLDPNAFIRVHRGAIVNIARIKEVQPWFSGAAVLILTTGQRLTVSRSYRKQFESRFGIQPTE